jgi:GNAT superfamily N-acetyltransferase
MQAPRREGEQDGFVEVRRARSCDAQQIAGTWLRSRAAAVPAIPPPIHSADEVHTWFETVVLPNKEVWIAEEDGTVLALLVLGDDWIDQLYVDPEHTGNGLGTDLVNLAKSRRPRGLTLRTFQTTRRAQRFYERHGFVPWGRRAATTRRTRLTSATSGVPLPRDADTSRRPVGRWAVTPCWTNAP